MNKTFIIILWLILGLFYWWLNTTHFDQCCTQKEKVFEVTTPSENKIVETPYYFTDNLDSIYIDQNSFETFYSNLKSKRNQGDTIQITGWRYRNEPELENGLELGLFRAQKMANYMIGVDIKGPFKLSSVLIGDKDFVDRWYNPDIFNLISKKNPEIQIEDTHTIYYQYGSSDHIKTIETSTYIDLAIKRVIASGEKIIVTGHTDSKSTSGFNQSLSIKRASKIAKILISKGVASDQIQIIGKGESDPIDSNNSFDMHRKNRRTTLEIKNQ